MNIVPSPGLIVLFGSGETSPSGRKIFDKILRHLPPAPRISLLETPAGFELNSPQVIGRVADFIQRRLQNYHPQVTIVPARQRGAPYSPDSPAVVAPLWQSELIFMGPGSPTYAVRQLRDSLAWKILLARHRLGAVLALASAATIAISAHALPVYEIYKVGEDLHWKPGLDFFGAYGLPLVFIPHWNNTDGGQELDTSRCFIGQARFAQMMEMLPPDLTVLGLDEKTALILDPGAGECHVVGLGGVTLIHTDHTHQRLDADLLGAGLAEVADQRNGHVHQYLDGQTFPLSECCPFQVPPAGEGLPPEIWQQALREHQALLELRARVTREPLPQPEAPEQAGLSPQVQALLDERQAARARQDWAASDALRARISGLGWQVIDTKQGMKVEKRL